ncbi:dTDP-glucose 4,6-dehydratase [Patescibacteria group bacterium]|nr:dTDP-glucose 4,6-dehydratase [Patescibacteria group bacterium]
METKKTILITGGAGFIGSNFVKYMLERYSEFRIIVLDKLAYAGRLENLEDVISQITFIKGDVCNKEDIEKIGSCDIIFNFAAETHVDKSISDPGLFLKTDIFGTYSLLEYAKKQKVEKFIQISTDEVYGSIKEGSFREGDGLEPSSPYSASKASADLLVGAYHKTYNLPVLITRSSNNFGPYQYPEKLIPLFITNALEDKPLPVYGDGLNVRDWLYVLDNCSAIDLVFQKGKFGEIYNIGTGLEKTNLEITELILKKLEKPQTLIQFVDDRLGHDRRYSLEFSKIKELGWKPTYDFEKAIGDTINWYKNNKQWWKSL